jgi:hypothetical protein
MEFHFFLPLVTLNTNNLDVCVPVNSTSLWESGVNDIIFTLASRRTENCSVPVAVSQNLMAQLLQLETTNLLSGETTAFWTLQKER